MTLFLLLFLLVSSSILGSTPNSVVIDPKLIYYSAPTFNIKNANVTFGANRRVGIIKNETAESVSETLTSICQAQLINAKQANAQFNGTLNLIFQDYINPITSGQVAAMRLLGNNFFYTSNGSKLNYEQNVDLTGFISVANFGTAKINSLLSNSFGIPFVSAGDLARSSPDNQFSGDFLGENRTFAQILNSFDFSTFGAVLEVLNYFNWTLVGNLYEGNTYGYNRQQSVLDYSANNSSPIFTCNFVFGVTKSSFEFDKQVADIFCRCIQVKNRADVIVMWMSTSAAYVVLKGLFNRCSAAKKWTYIITDDYQTPVNYFNDADIFKYSLLLRNNGPWNYKSFIQKCQQYASPQVKDYLDTAISDLHRINYNCEFENKSKNVSLSLCSRSLLERNETCICTSNELEADPYLTKFFYSADVINVYAEAISLLQNNCTFLNSQLYLEKIVNQDYCSLTSFTPADLSYAMRFVNFTGYTGPISFAKEVLIRRIKSYYLYSVYNVTIDAVLVGVLSQNSTEINEKNILFRNGKVPISRIIPQNVDFQFWIVDVVFGLSIIFIIICLYLYVFLIRNREYPAIRRSAPLITLIMLTGVFLLSLGQFFQSFRRTDAWCVIDLYFYRLGINILLMGLFIKNYRIYKIFNNRSARALNITEIDLVMIMAAAVLFYIAALTIFVTVFGYNAVLRKSSSNIYYQYVQCAIENKFWNFVLQFLLELSIVVLLVGSLVLAWLTRKVQSEFRESRELAAFATILFASLIIFVPLNFTLGDETNSQVLRYVLTAEFMTITIISAFALLFFPKVFEVQETKKKKKKKKMQQANN